MILDRDRALPSSRPRLLLVSPRPPRSDGQGDQRRAHVALCALSEDWAVEVVSWLPDAEHPLRRQWRHHPMCLVRAVLLAGVRPVQVAYVQALLPPARKTLMSTCDLVLYMTDRAVPFSPKTPYVIDFIDDLGGAAVRKARLAGGLRAVFWRWEGWRLQRLDARLAAGATLSLAISEHDAAAIAPTVKTIRAAIATRPMPDDGCKIAFTGNLFYPPNLDAAMWICDHLAPRLQTLGIDPRTIVVAGRRPPEKLRKGAASAGIDLRGDVRDLADVLAEAAVVISPVVFGSGVQNKVLDAVGARRACVLTPYTNQALGLEDGRSVVICDRVPDDFATAIVALLNDPTERRRLAENASRQLDTYTEAAVAQAWRRSIGSARHS